MVLTSATPDTIAQLVNLDFKLQYLESQLRLRGQWLPSTSVTPPTDLPSVLDLPDLHNATRLLTHIISSTHPALNLTAHSQLSAYSWTWDPDWKEYFTSLPTPPNQRTHIYLSRWKFDTVRNVWGHVSMDSSNLTAETAAEFLGAWEDWKWHDVCGEWYLEVEEDGDESRFCLFASRWEQHDDGPWIYVGSTGNLWQ